MAFQADLLPGVEHGEQSLQEQQAHDGLTFFAGRRCVTGTDTEHHQARQQHGAEPHPAEMTRSVGAQLRLIANCSLTAATRGVDKRTIRRPNSIVVALFNTVTGVAAGGSLP